MGSHLPTIRCFFDAAKVWRALAKMTINLFHAYCKRTPVDRDHFAQPIAEILGTRPFSETRVKRSGFVWASDVASLNAELNTHVCRLHGANGWWNAAFAFFGGQIGAAVVIPGPNHERWKTLDVRMPIESSDWTVQEISFDLPGMRFNVEWLKLPKIIPSMAFVGIES
jgi:hypothetical protein